MAQSGAPVGSVVQPCPRAAAALTVLVLHAEDNRPFEGIKVKVEGPSSLSGTTDAVNGVTPFDPVKPGRYTARATLPGSLEKDYDPPASGAASVSAGGHALITLRIGKKKVVTPAAPIGHWIEFKFVLPDETPVSDLDYVLVEPGGAQKPGTLGSDGKVERRNIPAGAYAVMLKDVAQVTWLPGHARCDDKVRLTAQTSGFPSGTPAKVNLYREFRETAADVIQSLPARVENDQIKVEWKYDYLSSEARKNETGVARFIAEVELDGGKHWAKSALALELELRTIKTLEWSTARIEAGETAEIKIETRGFPDDTEVRLELWRFGWNASKKVGDFRPLQLAGGTASARCPYAPAGAAELAITRSGEYFVIAKITGAVSRTARSSLLWCVYAEQDATESRPPS